MVLDFISPDWVGNSVLHIKEMTDAYVSGSSGFMGKRLCRKLQGHVEGIPNQQLSEYTFQPYRRFFWLSTYGNLAGQDNPLRLWESNVCDVMRVLDQLIHNPPYSHFLFVSTSSVLLPVQTPYSRSKRAVEEVLMAMEKFPSCIVRPYSVTGVGEQKQHLIPTLIRSSFTGEPMDFVPDATHDYIDVEDVVTGMMILSKIEARGIFEFGNRVAVTNEEVRRLVEEITGKKANIVSVGKMREYDNQDWCCKTPNEYWQPTKSLRQSITEMVAQYKHDNKL